MAIVAGAEELLAGLVAIQNGEVLLTQKTSRQQAVTPRFRGRLVNDDEEGFDVCEEELGCDWSRTRTTSSGVTDCHIVSKVLSDEVDAETILPRREVKRLPETADSIF